eukprot:GCRY01002557.1.p1 GENE.GCRY01002557.1~~GCRY01002557.1.p1  ORF type:complete len:470 (-),score=66.61 GCRY01002557.1:58-1467(-)
MVQLHQVKKYLFIRVDSGKTVGTGHIMRTLALARALKKHYVVTFLCANLEGNGGALIKKEGFELSYLSLSTNHNQPPSDDTPLPPHHHWLLAPWHVDAAATVQAITTALSRTEESTTHILCTVLVDHYGLDYRWETTVQQKVLTPPPAAPFPLPPDLSSDPQPLSSAPVKPPLPLRVFIATIDDLADRKHCADFLVDQNLHLQERGRYAALVPQHCAVLEGPAFSILHPVFAHTRQSQREQTRAAKLPLVDNPAAESNNNIPRHCGETFPQIQCFVFYGGSDSTGETLKFAKALSQALNSPTLPKTIIETVKKTTWHILVGAANVQLAQIAQTINALPNVVLHQPMCPAQLARLVADCDFAFGAGGCTTWERCCLGVPTTVTTVAYNQEEITAAGARAGVLRFLGKAEDVTVSTIFEEIQFYAKLFAENVSSPDHQTIPSYLVAMSEKGQRLVDGCGIKRIVAALLSLK